MRHTSFSRRNFLKASLVAASATFAAPAVLAERSPNSRLNIAAVGVGGRGDANIAEMGVKADGTEKLFAFCDVDSRTLAAQSDRYQVEHRFKDYREMLE